MRSLIIFRLAGVSFSVAREDQTGEMRDALDLLIRRVNNIEEALEEKNIENKELKERIENVQTANKELQEKIEDVRNPPFGYFCSYQNVFSAPNSVITYDKLLYSSQFGLQGDSPGIDINTGKFVSGFSGTWRVDFSLITIPDPGELFEITLYKNGEQIYETLFYSYRSSTGSGSDSSTGARSVLLHLDLGDELYLAQTVVMEKHANQIIFCVSLEQADV